MSEIILIIMLLLSLFIIYSLYKMFAKEGIYYSTILLSIIGFVLAFKISPVLKMDINLSIISFISIMTNMYIYILKYGKKEVNKIIYLTLYGNIMIMLLLIITNYFIPTITETISINMKDTFEYNYKILFCYPIIVYLSQYASVKLFSLVSRIQNNILISIVLTNIITSLIYTVLFLLISYINILSFRDSIFVSVSTYIIGFLISMIAIPFILFITGKKVIK